MKATALLHTLIVLPCLLLVACHAPSGTERQQGQADKLASDYLDCIEDLDHKTASDAYANPATRRDVVMESCREWLNRFTVVQEQAYNNTCMATGGEANRCDSEAVQRTRQDTDRMLQEALHHIEQTSRAARHQSRPL